MKKLWIIVLAIVCLLGGAYYFKDRLFRSEPKVEIGEAVVDQGREHVEDIYGINYNSNPPTSGTHFPIWAKPGAYDRLISDGYFIHSMEHGYIVIWYNCDKLHTAFKIIPEVFAHGDEEIKASTDSGKLLMHMTFKPAEGISWITPETQPEMEVKLPMSFETLACKQFVEDLKPFLQTETRVIIAPRINMDNKLTLTAWNRILKLDNIDKEKIETFIKTYHNKGPEKTME